MWICSAKISAEFLIFLQVAVGACRPSIGLCIFGKWLLTASLCSELTVKDWNVRRSWSHGALAHARPDDVQLCVREHRWTWPAAYTWPRWQAVGTTETHFWINRSVDHQVHKHRRHEWEAGAPLHYEGPGGSSNDAPAACVVLWHRQSPKVSCSTQ